MDLINTYVKTDRLFMTHTGNTTGMTAVGASDQATFVSLDDTLKSSLGIPPSTDPLTYAGTTDDWNLFGSWARLQSIDGAIPSTAVVDYAILIWMTTTGGAVTEALVDANPPIFTTPDGVAHTVEKNPAWDSTAATLTLITRAQDVTDIISALPNQGLGDYSVAKIPIKGPPAFGGGWGLVVVYKDVSYDYTNVSIYVGAIENGTPATTISGFYTPPTGDVKARVFALATQGDASVGGDLLELAGSALSGPRNQSNNFFQSQVCDYTGNLDTIGSFGNLNSNLGARTAKVRTSLDITNVDGSGIVGNGLTSTTLAVTGTGDKVVLSSFGLQLNANAANLELDKSANNSVVGKGDTVEYTLTITNAGSADAVNNVLKDVIDPNLTVSNIQIDGVASSGDLSNLSLPDIPAGSSLTITFDATVSPSSPSAYITNQYTVDYSFESIPGDPLISSTASSNINTISVIDIRSSCDKKVDKTSASPGDEITYTMTLSNEGDAIFDNVILLDTISSSASYVAGSLTVNGASVPGDLSSGVDIGTLSDGDTDTIVFKVTVNDESGILASSIINNATFNYDAVILSMTIPSGISTNDVETTLDLFADISLTKSVDKSNVDLGDTLEYNIDITNSGNVSANDMILIDTVPDGTTYVADSLTVNGASVSGDLNTGVNIGSIGAGETVNVKFKVTVNTDTTLTNIVNNASLTYNYTQDPTNPNGASGGATSNEITSTISYAKIDAQKSSNKEFIQKGGVYTYTISCKNTGSIDAMSVTISDVLDDQIEFVASSVKIDGISAPTEDPSNIIIDTINPSQTVTISFDVKVSDAPSKSDISNLASITYDYIVDPSNPIPTTKSVDTNEVIVSIKYGQLDVQKTSDKSEVIMSSIITYTITMTNSGNAVCENVVLKDQIPDHTEFVEGSLQIDGSSSTGDITTGVSIANLDPGQTIVATFQVKVVSI